MDWFPARFYVAPDGAERIEGRRTTINMLLLAEQLAFCSWQFQASSQIKCMPSPREEIAKRPPVLL